MKDKFNNQFATQRLRENISGEEFNVNKVWDFLETRPFANKEYMPKFNTAKEIYDEFGPKELELYAQYQWDGDDSTVHPKEAAALLRRANYDALSGKKELDEEGSVTGTGATFTAGTGEQYATTKAFKKVKKEEKDVEPKLAAGEADVYMKDKWGWKEAPSIPNRPSKGGFVYKQLFENMSIHDVELDYPEFLPIIQEVLAHFSINPSEAEFKIQEDYIEINVRSKGKTVMVDLLPNGQVTATVSTSHGGSAPVTIKENYSRFKKETKTRTNEQQLHAAMRLAEKKIHEANRILEYTAQLRGELNETRVNKNTQKLMEKVTRGIAEAYGKMKKLK